jgi:hypothetical protein
VDHLSFSQCDSTIDVPFSYHVSKHGNIVA